MSHARDEAIALRFRGDCKRELRQWVAAIKDYKRALKTLENLDVQIQFTHSHHALVI